jgi:hypothetical protein
MYTKQQRILFFIFGCITIRSLFVILAKTGNANLLRIMAIVAIGIALGFLYQFFVHPTKPGAFQNRPWWNYARPIHAFLYLLFASIILFTPYEKSAWIVLAMDIILGVLFFTIEYTRQ